MRFNLNGMISSDEDAPIWRHFGFLAFSPADLRGAIAKNPPGEEFVVEFNSGGGDVYAGFEMYSVLRSATCPTRGEVQSLAGSAASVVLAGVDTAAASPVAQVMIHLPSTVTEGNQGVHRDSIRMLDAVTDSILAAYERKAGDKTSRAELRRMMTAETFLTAQQALDAGLIDEIIGDAAPIGAATVLNSCGGVPDIAKLRAAYAEAHAEKKKPPETPEPKTEDAHRARVLALADRDGIALEKYVKYLNYIWKES